MMRSFIITMKMKSKNLLKKIILRTILKRKIIKEETRARDSRKLLSHKAQLISEVP